MCERYVVFDCVEIGLMLICMMDVCGFVCILLVVNGIVCMFDGFGGKR